jgi:hypothetical protein
LLLLSRGFPWFCRVLRFCLLCLPVAKLNGEFTSLEKPTDDSDMAIVAVVPTDRSDFIGSERQIDPKEPTR